MSKFKTLATIVSFISSILPFSSGAATQWTTTSGTAYIALNNGLAEFANGDSIKLSGVSSFLLTTGNHIIAAIDINDSNSLFIVSNDVTLGSVANSGITGQSLMISYGGAQTVTLSGTAGSGGSTIGLNDYSSLASVDFNNKDGILELNSVGVNYADNFQSTGGDNGTIKVLQNSTLSGVFNGTSGTMVKALVVAEDKSLVLNTNLNLSDVATLKSNTTLTVNSGFSINANRLELEGDNPSSLIFAHNTTLNAEILNLNPQNNIIEFQGASNILKKIDINGFFGDAKVIFSSNDPAHRSSLTNSISATVIETAGSTIGIDAEEIGLYGRTNINNTIFDLTLNTVLFSTGNTVITGDPKFNTTFNGTKGGHIAVEGKLIDMSGADTVTINLTDTSAVPGPEGRQYTIFAELRDIVDEEFSSEASILLPDNDIVTLNPPSNPLVKWTYSDGILRQVLVPNVDQVVTVLVPNNPNVTPVLNSSAREDLLNVVNQSGNAAQLLGALQPDVIALGSEPANQAAESASQMISGATRVIDARISNIQVTDSGLSGVTAGDTNNQIHGLWFMPFFGDVKQELRGTNPGYSAKYFGNILGFDTLFADDSTIGVALTFIKNIVNHKDSNNGDKSVIHTSVISLYGLKTLTNNWFVQGVLSLGSSKIDNKEIRFTFPNTSIASADYNSISTTTEITAGYTHSLSANTIITPLFGIEYTRLNKIDYTETGAGSQNLTVNRKEFNKAELIAGAKLDHSIVIEDFTFIPEIHGFVRYDAINKPLKITAALQGEQPTSLVPRTTVQTRVTYLVGAGFDIKKSNFEYGFGYDARIAQKYIAHQGIFKLRLIF